MNFQKGDRHDHPKCIRAFDPWQHTGIQSVLFNISKLPKRAEEGDGQWGTYPFLITHWGDSAIMNVVQTGEFWHQKKGLRREWLFDLCECLRPDEQTGRHLSQRRSLGTGFKLWLSLTSSGKVHSSDMNACIAPSHRGSIFQQTLTL